MKRPRPSPALGPSAADFVVVSGLSGAGKSHAIRALEDLGYFCVDNMPVPLIPSFAELTLGPRGSISRAAVVVDIREGQELQAFPSVYRLLKKRASRRVRLIFLDSADSALLRRFSETRRPHPLSREGTVADSIAAERRLLQSVRRLADEVIDSTTLTVHELRRRILESTGGADTFAPLAVNVVSFGFRRGVPPDADLLFDVRFLPNPHFVPSLRRWSGRNARVSKYVLRTKPAQRFLSLTTALLRFLIPQYISEGKAYLTIAIGCTGGRHRSVAIAEALGRQLKSTKGIRLQVRHRDVAQD